jgi:hypothetical protein
VTACPRCDHDPEQAVARRWEFTVGAPVPSLNDHKQNDGRGWAYRKMRDQWVAMMRFCVGRHQITRPMDKRRVLLTRLYSSPQREWDPDNLVGGCKPVIDAMVKAGILLGDSRKHAEISYRQEKGETIGVRFLVEELV